MREQQLTDPTGGRALGPGRTGAGCLATLPLAVTVADARRYFNSLHMRFAHNNCGTYTARIGMW
jgi:hypothetical protein